MHGVRTIVHDMIYLPKCSVRQEETTEIYGKKGYPLNCGLDDSLGEILCTDNPRDCDCFPSCMCYFINNRKSFILINTG